MAISELSSRVSTAEVGRLEGAASTRMEPRYHPEPSAKEAPPQGLVGLARMSGAILRAPWARR